MIKHIVMFRLKDSAEGHCKAENVKDLKVLLDSLKDKIPGIKYMETGINKGESGSAADIVLYSEFDNMEALENYRRHPDHTRAVDYIMKVCSERRVVDYEA